MSELKRSSSRRSSNVDEIALRFMVTLTVTDDPLSEMMKEKSEGLSKQKEIAVRAYKLAEAFLQVKQERENTKNVFSGECTDVSRNDERQDTNPITDFKDE